MKKDRHMEQAPAKPVAIRDCLPEGEVERGRNSPRKGKMVTFDGHACLTGRCGSITACGSRATAMAVGRTADEVLEVTGEAIIREVGDFPQAEAHCAFLAAETLQEALHDSMVRQKTRNRK